MQPPRVVIVGAGEAGVRAAFALREQGHEGSITLLSEEEVVPYERPPLSKSGGTVRAIMPQEAYAERQIDLRLGTKVEQVDPAARQLRLPHEVLDYDLLLLATGAEPRRLPDVAHALYLRRDADARQILSRLTPGCHLVIVGGGFIGLELAASARSFGADVTVVEAAPRILGRAVLPDIAEALHWRHEAEGVRIVTGQSARIEDDRVVLEDQVLPADVLVVGIGSVPRTDLAAEAGLRIDNGILVGAQFRTSDPAIYAAGDCCAIRQGGRVMRFESWRMAREQAECAAAAMLGRAEGDAPLPYFWSDQYDLCLQVLGLPDPGKPSHARRLTDGSLMQFQLDDDGCIQSVSALGPGTVLSKEVKLAERLMRRRSRHLAADLCDPEVSLKRIQAA
jgi:3-phenylpropionate/trans-cinnamate dioxygenase ferredoxin reductase component